MFHVKHFGVVSVAISVALCTTAVGRDAYLDQTFGFDVQRDIVYGTGSVGNPASGEIDLLLDLYEPVGLPGHKPGLVYIHGGSFDHGDKASFVPASMAEEYASRGYVVASINYRMRYDDPTYEPGLWDDTSWEARAIPAAVNDADKAVRWMRENASTYNVDSSRMVIGGGSAGAITALLQGYQELGRDSEVGAVIDFMGALYRFVSEVDADDPPLFIAHGTEDSIVPFSYAQEIVSRADVVGLPFEFLPIEGEDHGWHIVVGEYNGVTALQESVEFLFNHLNLAELAPGPRHTDVQLINAGEHWSFFPGIQEPSDFPDLAWTSQDFDDRDWNPSQEGFGYGRGIEDRDVASVLDDMADHYSTVYTRHRFDVADPDHLSALLLEIDYDDAFVAYVNGVEVARSQIGTHGTPEPFDAEHEPSGPVNPERPAHAPRDFHFIDLATLPDLLQKGNENVLAVQGISAGGSDRDFVLSQISLSALAPMLQAGDADQDLDFDQLDLVRVQVAGKYRSGGPATWGEGDWDGAPGGYPGSPPPGDRLFNQFDIVAAQQAANYLAGPYRANTVVAVPEPSSYVLLTFGLLALGIGACRYAETKHGQCRRRRP